MPRTKRSRSAAPRTEKVTGDETITISGKRTEKVTGDESVTLSGARTVKVSMDDALKVSMGLKIEAGTELSIKCGQSSISMNAAGIVEIKGLMVTVKADANLELKASAMLTGSGAMISWG